MPRMSYDDMANIVKTEVEAAGGEIEHNALIDRLNASGNGRAGSYLVRMAQRRDIIAHVASVPDSTPVLRYRLPQSRPAAPQTFAPSVPGGGDGS